MTPEQIDRAIYSAFRVWIGIVAANSILMISILTVLFTMGLGSFGSGLAVGGAFVTLGAVIADIAPAAVRKLRGLPR